MHVLLSSYACAPNSGSEPGSGWNWAIHIAGRGHTVTVLTTVENRSRILQELEVNPLPGITFNFVPMPRLGLREATGLHYLIWQWMALRLARELAREQHFDVIHHVSYGSVHVPSQLWRLGIPVVFGPAGGGQVAPASMLPYFGKSQRQERLRTFLTRLIAHSAFHRKAFRNMGAVLVANSETLRLVRKLGRKDAELMPDTGISSLSYARTARETSGQPLRVLWVGRMLPRKAIGLSLDIFQKVTAPATLTILGYGQEPSEVRAMIRDRHLEDRVFWSGERVPFDEVHQAYLEHDVLLFNSLRESGGSQLCEAMAMGLPIVTLNVHGPGDMVPSNAGFKIDVHDPAQVVREMAEALDAFAALSSEQRSRMSAACWRFAEGQTYARRAEHAENIYKRLVKVPAV